MGKATQEIILERRKDMLYLDRMGLRPKDWVQELALKYKTTPDAVKRDWSRRKVWIRQLLKIADAEALALDILYDYERAMQDAYRLYDDAEKVADRIHALWARLKAIQLREKYLETIGALTHLQLDFQYAADDHRERKMEARYPYLKGSRDRHIRSTALLLGAST